MEEKICTKCNIKKPLSEFYKDKNCKFGVRGDCKECLRIPHIKKILPKGHKECTKCNRVQPFNCFNKDKNKKFGLSGWCRKCRYPEKPKEIFPKNSKRCTKCKEIKLLDNFFTDKTKKDDKTCRCKKCLSRVKSKEILLEGSKRCIKCKEIKLLSEFSKSKINKDGFIGQCKDCKKKYNERYTEEHKKEIQQYRKQYYNYVPVEKEKLPNGVKRCSECKEVKLFENFDKNKRGRFGITSKCKECRKQWSLEHKEEINKYKREWVKNNKKQHRNNQNQYKANRYKNDPLYKLNCIMRSILKRTFKLIKTKKEKRTINELGYDAEQLMKRLEMNFTDKMNWKNHGIYWEIDHIIPIDYFIKKEIKDPKIINALSNLQPLICKKNREKSNKIII